jgi:hypothetical protein
LNAPRTRSDASRVRVVFEPQIESPPLTVSGDTRPSINMVPSQYHLVITFVSPWYHSKFAPRQSLYERCAERERDMAATMATPRRTGCGSTFVRDVLAQHPALFGDLLTNAARFRFQVLLSSPSRPPWLPRGPRVLLPCQVKLLTPSLPCIRIPVQFFLYSNAPSTRTNSRPSCICASQCNQTVCCGCRDAEARPPPLFTWFSSSQLLNAFSEISLYIGVSLGGSNIV